jgi:DeoR/GlpR family transcriptional regulator of sugar metabolism
MLREERLWQISKQLLHDHRVLAKELAEQYELSPAAIRLDLAELERRGLAQRVYGGAILAAKNRELYPPSFEEPRFIQRSDRLQNEKEAIGRAAADLVENDETIMVDAGTTTLHICRHLGNKHGLTLITSAVNEMWAELAASTDTRVFLTGGLLYPESLSMVGEVAETMLTGFRANKAILGIDGVSLEHGLTTMSYLEVGIKKRMIEASQELIIVVDHSKLGKVGLMPVATIESVSTIVTDSGAPADFVHQLEQRGVNVITASMERFDNQA